MRWIRTAGVLALLLPLAACGGPVVSLYPFFDEKDVVYEPGLVGQWVGKGNMFNWELRFKRTENPPNTYELDFAYYGKPKNHEPWVMSWHSAAHVFRVGDSRFLDVQMTSRTVSRTNGGLEENSDDLTPPHTVYRVELEGDRLLLAWLDEEAVKRFVTEHKLPIAAQSPQCFRLTGAPRELQEALLARADSAELLSKDMEFERRK